MTPEATEEELEQQCHRLYRRFLNLCKKIAQEKKNTEKCMQMLQVSERWYLYALQEERNKRVGVSNNTNQASLCELAWPDAPVLREAAPWVYHPPPHPT